MTSEQLIAEYARTKDAELFAELVRRHKGIARSVALSITRDPELAEDALQDTWLSIVRHAGQFAGRSAAQTWIIAIVRRRAITVAKRRTIRWSRDNSLELLGVNIAEPVSGPLEVLMHRESAAELLAAVGQLSSGIRRVIEITELWEGTEKDAMQTLGIPKGTVKSRRHRGISQLRKTLAAA